MAVKSVGMVSSGSLLPLTVNNMPSNAGTQDTRELDTRSMALYQHVFSQNTRNALFFVEQQIRRLRGCAFAPLRLLG